MQIYQTTINDDGQHEIQLCLLGSSNMVHSLEKATIDRSSVRPAPTPLEPCNGEVRQIYEHFKSLASRQKGFLDPLALADPF